MKIILTFLIILFISTNSFGASREEKIVTLMKAQGLIEIFEEQIELREIQAEQHAKQTLEQVISQLKLDDSFMKPFEEAYNSFIKKIQSPWSAEDIVDVWAEFYGEGFTDKELDELISFYTSEVGKKEIRVSKEALIKYTEHFQELGQPIMKKAMDEYLIDLKSAITQSKEANKNDGL
jgi:hypothetical protein